ncbi:MAG: DUF1343 domain-containing protein [Opitutaceae bacterium]|jgi:uncharacterized protein YbbC (DUF1343 family)|nr:DUF1343 domain-containing protein [Opitutaceae bacterium]
MRRIFHPLLGLGLLFIGLFGCSNSRAPEPAPTVAAATAPAAPVSPARARPTPASGPVMLGIDVLAADNFAAVRGKRIGLLTHPAGVNRHGVATVDILHRAPGVKLVALFAPEHAFSGTVKAGLDFEDERHPSTGLPIYSLHGKNRKPTAAQLKGLDALVIDLQDIGVRSYTFNVVMRYAMDSCFTHGVEVIVLDRPNPLGGLKVDGPHLDREWMSGVGAFRIPYVHGLTMGELARLAAGAPGVLDVPEAIRAKGKLTVIPMRGWHRAMRWPETGLRFVPTSPLVRDFPAVIGYAMTGLGCEYSGFKHGLGPEFPFRAITFKGRSPEQIKADLEALKIPGLAYRVITRADAQGRPIRGLYIDVIDWHAWQPTRLSFELMRLACRYDPPNPFVKLGAKESRSFNIHVGSTAWWNALRADGAKVNLPAFLADWEARAAAYQQQTKRYWLY